MTYPTAHVHKKSLEQGTTQVHVHVHTCMYVEKCTCLDTLIQDLSIFHNILLRLVLHCAHTRTFYTIHIYIYIYIYAHTYTNMQVAHTWSEHHADPKIMFIKTHVCMHVFFHADGSKKHVSMQKTFTTEVSDRWQNADLVERVSADSFSLHAWFCDCFLRRIFIFLGRYAVHHSFTFPFHSTPFNFVHRIAATSPKLPMINARAWCMGHKQPSGQLMIVPFSTRPDCCWLFTVLISLSFAAKSYQHDGGRSTPAAAPVGFWPWTEIWPISHGQAWSLRLRNGQCVVKIVYYLHIGALPNQKILSWQPKPFQLSCDPMQRGRQWWSTCTCRAGYTYPEIVP